MSSESCNDKVLVLLYDWNDSFIRCNLKLAIKHRNRLLKQAILEIMAFLDTFCEIYIVFCFWKSKLYQFFWKFRQYFDKILTIFRQYFISKNCINPFHFNGSPKLCHQELVKVKFQTTRPIRNIWRENGKDYKKQLIMHF